MAQFLNVNPADLTVLKKNSGGEYPFMRIFQTIDGRAVIAGHGERAMPVWGGVIKWRALNLKTAVGSRQSRQALGAPRSLSENREPTAEKLDLARFPDHFR